MIANKALRTKRLNLLIKGYEEKIRDWDGWCGTPVIAWREKIDSLKKRLNSIK